MIRGLGIDLVENFRIKKIYDRYGNRFTKRILDNEEIRDFNISNDKNKRSEGYPYETLGGPNTSN